MPDVLNEGVDFVGDYKRLIKAMPPRVLKAYELWEVSRNVAKVAETVGVHRNTVTRWKRKYKWEEIDEERFKDLTNAEDADFIKALREAQREIVELLIERAKEDIDVGYLKVRDVRELIQLMKYHRELVGDKVGGEESTVEVLFNIADLHETITERRRKLLMTEDLR